LSAVFLASVLSRNDGTFYLYNDTFTRPLDEPLYTLRRIEPARDTDRFYDPPSYFCEDPTDPYDKRSNNEAPCGPVTAGGGGGGGG
jgi:hypothetical protein